MGFFTKGQQAVAESTYTNAKQYLKAKDGKVHVVMFKIFRLVNPIL